MKKEANKKIIIIFIIAIIITLTLIFLLYSTQILKKTPEEPLKGEHIKNATINKKGTTINITLKTIPLENVTKLKFIFINQTNHKFYYYQNRSNQTNYLINSTQLGLSDFLKIKKVLLEFQWNETNQTIQVDVNQTITNQTETNTSTTTGGSTGGGGGSTGGGSTGGDVCVPEPLSVTCGTWECGVRINNCGSGVNCGTCETWEICENGICVSECTNDPGCSSEGTFCEHNRPYTCSAGSDGCYDRTNLTECSSNEICYLGTCETMPECTDDSDCTEFTNVCSTGKCTLGKCEINYNTTGLCRNSVRECDQEETCSGTSEICPPDLNKSDGETCSLGNCSSGICVECIVDTDCSQNEICVDKECVNQSIICVDGTPNGNCSALNPPLYCNSGNLTFDVNKCSADPGKCCQSTKSPAPYAVFLAVNIPYSEDCSQAYTYFDTAVIGGFWINKTFYESSGIALGIGGYPTNIQCRQDRTPIINSERGVRNKTNSFIFVPWDDSISGKQAQVAILDWNYTKDSYYYYNNNFELKKISYLDCSDFQGDICLSTEYCSGNQLEVADTDRCCNVECQTPIWAQCSECGSGLLKECDRTECNSITEGCYFLDNHLTECNTCDRTENCFSYLNDSQTCLNDPCDFGRCFWNSTTNSCEEQLDCSTINQCSDYSFSEVCLNDPCNLQNCFYDTACRTDVCTDTDGLNYETYGTCYDNIIHNNTSPVQDSCNNNIITEYTCNNHYCYASDYDCTLMGGTCDSGRCVVSTAPTIEIDSCSELTQSNTIYKLNQSIVSADLNDDCIKITAQNVILDCDHHSITGEDYYSGIYSDQDQTTIRNCEVSMGYASFSSGIELRESRNHHIYNNTLNTQGRGITLISVNDSLIEENTAKHNLMEGFYSVSGNNNKFMNNLAENNSEHGIFLSEAYSHNLTSNTFNNNTGDGIYLTLSNHNSITNNKANYNRRGIFIIYSNNNSIIENQFCSNSENDLRCYTPQIVLDNECENINGCGGTCTPCSSLPSLSAFSIIWEFIKNILSKII